MPGSNPTGGRVSAESVLVLCWREEQALLLGLDIADALRFAESNADLAQLRGLIAAGCAPALAARIVT